MHRTKAEKLNYITKKQLDRCWIGDTSAQESQARILRNKNNIFTRSFIPPRFQHVYNLYNKIKTQSGG